MKRISICSLTIWFFFGLAAQVRHSGAPVITAAVKGPNQINLTWLPMSGTHYGYLIEIRSAADARYTNWTELSPTPPAAGYTCDSSVVINNNTCSISDPTGAHIYTPPTNAVPYWVTDVNYTDPQDDTPAQFIAAGLQPGASYDFRVRTYTGGASPQSGPYSNIATATTARYPLRYVAPNGNDNNDGTAADAAHAWRTIYHGTFTLRCGQELIVMGGNYPSDGITMQQGCTANSKAVILVNPGDTATITSMGTVNIYHPILLLGSHIVIDGLKVVSPNPTGDYDIEIDGAYNALLNVEGHPPVVPNSKAGVYITNQHNLIYHSHFHDYGSPDAKQNPSGNNGFTIAVYSTKGTDNVVWSNHLTRGGHDVSLCKSGCSFNRWLNNVMDGGWGMAFESIDEGAVSDHNLVEGNIMYHVGRLVSFYKPAMELSSSYNTARRNVVINPQSWGVEESAFGGNADHNLVYNNVFYAPAGCIFQSQNGGATVYDDIVYANNICYKLTNVATDIYSGNTTDVISRNTIAAADQNGNLVPGKAIVIWNHSAQGNWQYPQTLDYADKSYSPPFKKNKGLDVDPKFVDEANFDFHLSAASPLNSAGMTVYDTEWGTAEGGVDLGAFGIRLPVTPPPPAGHPRPPRPLPGASGGQ